VADLNQNHDLTVTKTRYRTLDNRVIRNPGVGLGKEIRDWLDGNEAEAEPTDRLLVEVGTLMKRKMVGMDKLTEAGYQNPREMDAEALRGLVGWLKKIEVS